MSRYVLASPMNQESGSPPDALSSLRVGSDQMRGNSIGSVRRGRRGALGDQCAVANLPIEVIARPRAVRLSRGVIWRGSDGLPFRDTLRRGASQSARRSQPRIPRPAIGLERRLTQGRSSLRPRGAALQASSALLVRFQHRCPSNQLLRPILLR